VTPVKIEESRSALNIDSVLSMLSFIPSDDRDIWITVGMSLKSDFSGSGLELFDDWSQSAGNYDQKAVREVWSSFKGTGRTIGSIVYLARQFGWSQDCTTPLSSHTDTTVQTGPSTTVGYALRLFLGCSRDDHYVAKHPYAMKKGIGWAAGAGRAIASGKIIGSNADCIIVPIQNIGSGKVQGVECINADGKKQTFGKKTGGALILGNSLGQKSLWYIVEGWASCVSTVFHHNQQVAVCAFGKSSLRTVAESIAAVYHPKEIMLLREVDE
jgi:hypothetical protein